MMTMVEAGPGRNRRKAPLPPNFLEVGGDLSDGYFLSSFELLVDSHYVEGNRMVLSTLWTHELVWANLVSCSSCE